MLFIEAPTLNPEPFLQESSGAEDVKRAVEGPGFPGVDASRISSVLLGFLGLLGFLRFFGFLV